MLSRGNGEEDIYPDGGFRGWGKRTCLSNEASTDEYTRRVSMLRVLLLLLSICITVPLFPLRVRAHTGLYEDRCQVGGLLSRIFFSERTSTSHLGEKRSRPDEKQSQLRCNATINSRVTPSYPSPLDSKSCLQSVFPFNRGQRGENYDSEKLQIVGGAATIVGR